MTIKRKVSGVLLVLSGPFAEGHPCTAAQAAFLSRAALTKSKKTAEDTVAVMTDPGDKKQLKAAAKAWAAAAASVSFSRTLKDPIQVRALQLAKDRIVAKLVEQNAEPWSGAKLLKNARQAVKDFPQFVEMAEAEVSAHTSLPDMDVSAPIE